MPPSGIPSAPPGNPARPSLRELLAAGDPVILEGAIVERLRRDSEAPPLDPLLANAAHPLTEAGRDALAGLWRGYLDAIEPSALPALLLSPTWRASAERAHRAGIDVALLNGEGVRLARGVRDGRRSPVPVLVGGLLGCAGDAYRPEEGLEVESALRFHAPQAEALAAAGADFLLASTLPALPEAIGLALAMLATGVETLVGFVLRPNGCLLDGTSLDEAIRSVDGAAAREGRLPAGYLATCTHPDTLFEALASGAGGDAVPSRLVGIQGNGSRLSPEELDGRAEIDTTGPEEFAAAMSALRNRFGLRLFGGCCGTDERHIAALAAALAGARALSPPRGSIRPSP